MAVTERPVSHGVSDLQDQISDGLDEHKSMWELLISTAREVRRLSGECEQLKKTLHQRDLAYDTLVRAGEESQRRALGLEPKRTAPKHRGERHLRAVPGVALIATLSAWVIRVTASHAAVRRTVRLTAWMTGTVRRHVAGSALLVTAVGGGTFVAAQPSVLSPWVTAVPDFAGVPPAAVPAGGHVLAPSYSGGTISPSALLADTGLAGGKKAALVRPPVIQVPAAPETVAPTPVIVTPATTVSSGDGNWSGTGRHSSRSSPPPQPAPSVAPSPSGGSQGWHQDGNTPPSGQDQGGNTPPPHQDQDGNMPPRAHGGDGNGGGGNAHGSPPSDRTMPPGDNGHHDGHQPPPRNGNEPHA